jgi:hypothetical protein
MHIALSQPHGGDRARDAATIIPTGDRWHTPFNSAIAFLKSFHKEKPMPTWNRTISQIVDKSLPVKASLTDGDDELTLDLFLDKSDPDLKQDTMALRLKCLKVIDGNELTIVCRPLAFDGSVKKGANLDEAAALPLPEVTIARISLPELYQKANEKAEEKPTDKPSNG